MHTKSEISSWQIPFIFYGEQEIRLRDTWWMCHSELTDQLLYVNLQNQNQTLTLCNIAPLTAPNCQTRLVKSRFCYCVAYLMPEMFSETYLFALFSCKNDIIGNSASMLETTQQTRSPAQLTVRLSSEHSILASWCPRGWDTHVNFFYTQKSLQKSTNNNRKT